MHCPPKFARYEWFSRCCTAPCMIEVLQCLGRSYKKQSVCHGQALLFRAWTNLFLGLAFYVVLSTSFCNILSNKYKRQKIFIVFKTTLNTPYKIFGCRERQCDTVHNTTIDIFAHWTANAVLWSSMRSRSKVRQSGVKEVRKLSPLSSDLFYT